MVDASADATTATPASASANGTEEVEQLRSQVKTLQRRLKIRHRLRQWTATILVVLACVTTVAAVGAGWARYNFLNTDRFVSKVAPLATDPEVVTAVDRALTRQVTGLVDEKAFFESILPERGQILAVPLGNAVDRFLADKVDEFVHSDRFAELWTNAITRAHSRAIAVLKGDTNSRFFTVQGTQVVLDLAPVISAVLQRIAEAAPGLFSKINIPELSNENIQNAADRISAALGVQLPPNFGTIPVFDKSKLSNAQDAFRKVNRLVVAIVLLALILTTAAIAMSTNRRRTVMVIAIGFALGMIVARRLTIRVREDLPRHQIGRHARHDAHVRRGRRYLRGPGQGVEERAAVGHQIQRVLDGEYAGNRGGGIFADAVTDENRRLDTPGPPQSGQRVLERDDERRRIDTFIKTADTVRCVEFLQHRPAAPFAHAAVASLQDVFEQRLALVQLPAHTRVLQCLAAEEERDLHVLGGGTALENAGQMLAPLKCVELVRHLRGGGRNERGAMLEMRTARVGRVGDVTGRPVRS